MIRKACLRSILVHDLDEQLEKLSTDILLGSLVNPNQFTRLHERLSSISMPPDDHDWFKACLRSIEMYYAVGETPAAEYSLRFARKRLQSRL